MQENEVIHENQTFVRRSASKQRLGSQNSEGDEIITFDTIRIYCTEDTPTFVSPYGSQSNLSTLSRLSFSDENLNFSESCPQQSRTYYEEEQRLDCYSSDDASASEYSDADENDRRIDVSPFDSQLNLVNFSLLCIDEEDEDLEPEITSNETDDDKLAYKSDSCSKDLNSYKRLSYENSDISDEDRQVLEECIKSGVSKLTRCKDFELDKKRHNF